MQSVLQQAGAAAAVGAGQDILGSILFCCALNHKQMAAYYAPAFFAHLLGRCLQQPSLPRKVTSKLLPPLPSLQLSSLAP